MPIPVRVWYLALTGYASLVGQPRALVLAWGGLIALVRLFALSAVQAATTSIISFFTSPDTLAYGMYFTAIVLFLSSVPHAIPLLSRVPVLADSVAQLIGLQHYGDHGREPSTGAYDPRARRSLERRLRRRLSDQEAQQIERILSGSARREGRRSGRS